ncbi:MAG: response regulator [Bacteriovoracaceae bacterium]|jgi:CheY-like chemotaxis protein|nr:response regulator [Bacteriovoracaceae bacterium]
MSAYDQNYYESTFTYRTLVVDDDSGVREVVCEMLKELGMSVIDAKDADEALEIYEKNPFKIDLIISDVNMPGMDGKKLLERINHLDPDNSPPKMVVITGNTQDDISEKYNRMRNIVSGYLFKPFNIDHLKELLNTI